jgi:HK97 family phage prohead protease
MKVEIRNDSVFISGYVNAVERWSKPISGNLRGVAQRFIEKIKAGVFKTALKRNNNVKILLNHNKERELANTENRSAILEEDNIGLRAEVTITDPEVVEKARNNKLVGWSFGFYSNSDEVAQEETIATRTVTDMDLVEVSILDDTRSPAYYGTSIETRSESEKVLEYRAQTIDEIEAEAQAKHKALYKADYSITEEQHRKIDSEKKEKEIEYFADIVAKKVVEKLNPPIQVNVAENREEETEAKTVEGEATENRSIDYSAFEERLAKLN